MKGGVHWKMHTRLFLIELHEGTRYIKPNFEHAFRVLRHNGLIER